jgi:hypothetical protein
VSFVLKLIGVLLFFCKLTAADNEFVIVEQEQVVEEDFFACSSWVEISGVCKKDVYVIGSQVLVDGVIEGDLICLAGALQISGRVKGALRGLAGQSLISGYVGKNVTLGSAAFSSTGTSVFDSNVYLVASGADLSGQFAQDLYVGASNIRYGAQGLSNLHLYAANIGFNWQSRVEGYVDYSSTHPIKQQKGAVIKGGFIENSGAAQIYSHSVVLERLLTGSKLAAVLMNLLFTLLIGFLLIKFWPGTFVRSAANLDHHPLRSVIHGLGFVVAAMALGLVLLVTILGIPIAITLIAFSVLGLYTAKIYPLYFIAQKIQAKLLVNYKGVSLFALFSFFCCLYFFVQMIPYLSQTLSWIFTLSGIGATVYLPKTFKQL